ncbi:MAG: hypothetical protein E7208_05455 [Clostridium butyricum]|nr:hypothetical protein [Clostridium butyricum]
MEETKDPIIIKKKNGFMISVGIAEIVFGLVWSLADGIKSIPMWIFVVTGIITLLSVWVEYSRDIYLRENKIDFYKNKDLIESIKYSDINELSIKVGDQPKDKNKKFLNISFSNNGKKKVTKKSYSVCVGDYGVTDLAKMRQTILSVNSKVKVSKEVKEIEVRK